MSVPAGRGTSSMYEVLQCLVATLGCRQQGAGEAMLICPHKQPSQSYRTDWWLGREFV